MMSAGLLSLPTEMLLSVCTFLRKNDVMALSYTCLHLNRIINHVSFWEGYYKQEIMRVRNFCPDNVDRKEILLRANLLANWKNGEHALQHCEHNIETVDDVFFYKEDFMLVRNRDKIYFWDIRDAPVLESMTFLPNTRNVFLIKEYLVLVLSNNLVVDVRKINLDERNLGIPHEYSFLIAGEEVVYGIPSLVCDDPTRQPLFSTFTGLDFFVAIHISGDNLSIQVWNVVDARKVGKFLFPRIEFCYNTEIHSVQGNQMFIKGHTMRGIHFLKFDLLLHELSDTTITVPHQRDARSKVVFYNNHCIKFFFLTNDDVRCETIDLRNPITGQERYFDDVPKRVSVDTGMKMVGLVVCGKFALPRREKFDIIDVCTLDTLWIVAHYTPSILTMYPISVYGSFFLVTSQEKHLRVWDIEKNKIVLERDSFAESNKVLCSELKTCLRSEDESKSLYTKFVVFSINKVEVTHFVTESGTAVITNLAE